MKRQWIDRADRLDTSLYAEVAGPTSAPFRSRVRNISTTGMLIDAPEAVAVGDILIVQMPDGRELICAVVRRRAGSVGIRFVEAIPATDLGTWAASSGDRPA
jgi:hypothetical protein